MGRTESIFFSAGAANRSVKIANGVILMLKVAEGKGREFRRDRSLDVCVCVLGYVMCITHDVRGLKNEKDR